MRRNIHNMQKRRRVIVLLLFMIISLTMKAQVFMMDGDENYREPENPQVFAGLPEDYGAGYDYYAPVGNGIMVLVALGGAYLAKKGKLKNSKINKKFNK